MARPITLALLLALLCLVPAAASRAAAPPAACVTVRAEARYRNYGYDHLVHLRSRCAHAVRCRVATSVQPRIHRVRLAPGGKTTVVTMVGSPARAFEPRVTCERVP